MPFDFLADCKLHQSDSIIYKLIQIKSDLHFSNRLQSGARAELVLARDYYSLSGPSLGQ